MTNGHLEAAMNSSTSTEKTVVRLQLAPIALACPHITCTRARARARAHTRAVLDRPNRYARTEKNTSPDSTSPDARLKINFLQPSSISRHCERLRPRGRVGVRVHVSLHARVPGASNLAPLVTNQAAGSDLFVALLPPRRWPAAGPPHTPALKLARDDLPAAPLRHRHPFP